ncbi:Abi family protein [Actinomyces slackii]|uniref:Abi family protein n=1 Tax=Actinomyces slackii TaxID=52774 RepID=UPI0022B2A2D0|nr:Abi family protein [Actinomyces slackii]
MDTFLPDTRLAQVVSVYEFDHELRNRVGSILSIIETAFRFFIGHRLGMINTFAHREPYILGAVRQEGPDSLTEPTAAYREWLSEYDRLEGRARGDFVTHFREKYGPHLPIWVATEVMSFGALTKLYGLMRQSDQEIIAARFQIRTADGRGDRGALNNWLNNLRNVRNICAHYGRLWNRTFDVLIDAPGRAREDADDLLASLVRKDVNNRLYGVLIIMRYLLLSIAPGRADVVDLVDFIEERADSVGFDIGKLGFPDKWRGNPIWSKCFMLDHEPMLAANLLDRASCMTAAEAREALTSAQPTEVDCAQTSTQTDRAMKAAQRALLRAYLKYGVVIEIQLGKTKYYPTFQFRDGKIIDALAEINRKLSSSCDGVSSVGVAKALLDWWQTPHPDLPSGEGGRTGSPLDLLNSVCEKDFAVKIDEVNATGSFSVST